MGANIKSKILLIDNDSQIITSVSSVLAKEGFFIHAFSNAEEASAKIMEEHYDVVLTDVGMPEISGIDLLEKTHKLKPQLPVILMTAYPDFNMAVEAVRRRVFDILLKPFPTDRLVEAIKRAVQYNSFLKLKKDYRRSLENMIVEKTRELGSTRKQADGFSTDLVGCLTAVAEFRDSEARLHGARVGAFSELIARSLGMSLDFSRKIKVSGQLHDIGKIHISNDILFKPAPLTAEELELVKRHTTEGKRLLAGSSHPVIQMAESIALNHHERWDGTGYPKGLKREDIPLEGRIVMIADQYDAIRSHKPYKQAIGHEEAVRILTQGNERTSPDHFDPQVLYSFIKLSRQFDLLYNSIKH